MRRVLSYVCLMFFLVLASVSALAQDTDDQKELSAASSIPAPLEAYFDSKLKERLSAQENQAYPVFGHHLFGGRYDAALTESRNPDYVIATGDQITVALWGAVSQTYELVVDSNGVIFIPEVGPVKVGGIRRADLNSEVLRQVSRVFSENVNVYSHLDGSSPVYVFVSGAVLAPGQYEGASSDSLLRFVDKAGGIDPEKGSFRELAVIRNGVVLKTFDLYSFLLDGDVPFFPFKDGDTVLIRPRGGMVQIGGVVLNQNRFELSGDTATGRELIEYSRPLEAATHVQVITLSNSTKKANYMDIKAFRDYVVKPGDIFEFISDITDKIGVVSVEGPHDGPKRLIIQKGTKLGDLLRLIPVDEKLADSKSIYLRRKSVAIAQKEALMESINRLERSLIDKTSVSAQEAGAKLKEAELVRGFIDRIKEEEPEGRVVLGNMIDAPDFDIHLEDGDVIVIPQVTDLVRVSGEVFSPRAILYKSGNKVSDYIDLAGGINERGNKKAIVVARNNGAIVRDFKGEILPGDEIVVLPKAGRPSLEVTAAVADIVFKAITSAVLPLALILDD